jgi:hypothetical protein
VPCSYPPPQPQLLQVGCSFEGQLEPEGGVADILEHHIHPAGVVERTREVLGPIAGTTAEEDSRVEAQLKCLSVGEGSEVAGLVELGPD